MSPQDRWEAHLSYVSVPERQHCTNMGADDSSTFVNPLHEGSLQPSSPYVYAPETAIPPPPPGIDSLLVFHSKRNTGYRIALVVLLIVVVALGSLEVIQVAAHLPLATFPSGIAGSNQAGATSAHSATTPQKTFPVRTVTPGKIKVNAPLTCGTCNDPVLTTLTSITIDTTNLRVIMIVTLHNISGAQQVDYFAEFSLQDPFGNTFEGTGELNTDFTLGAGQRGIKTEIFSFLPSPGVSYTLIARLGISGTTYDPFQLTF